MREIRLSGSEGGGTQVLPTPIYKATERGVEGPRLFFTSSHPARKVLESLERTNSHVRDG
jgi:hypothetical protein